MRRFAVCALVVLIAVAAQAQAEERTYRFGEYGALRLTVPDGWQESHKFVGPMENSVGLAITYKSATPGNWEILISAFWNLGEQPPGDPAEREKAVQQIAAKTLGQVKEQSIKVVPIGGDPSLGYMFSVTDTEERPGGYFYLTQGIAQVGDVLASFSVLSNGDRESIEQATVRLLQSARHEKQ